MDFLIFSIILLLIGSITAHFAAKRGRSPINWFLIGALLGIMGLLLLFLLPNLATGKSLEKSSAAQTTANQPMSFDQPNTVSEYKRKKWFYLDNTHAQQGPVDFEKLMPAWKNKEISGQTFVWSEGMADWKKIEELQQFQSAILKENP